MFPNAGLTLEDLVSSWAGIRPLLYQAGKKPTEISRKDEVFTSESGLITVAGGKLTGYRHLAAEVVNTALSRHFPGLKKSSGTRNIKLEAGKFKSPEEVKTFLTACQREYQKAGFENQTIAYLVRNYGLNASQILEQAVIFKPNNPDNRQALLKAEIWYAIQAEGAASLCDFLIRRTGKLYFERKKLPGFYRL